MNEITLRPYTDADLEACLEVMRSNVPEYFAHEEMADFQGFLQGTPQPYFVLLQGGEVCGCGGVALFPSEAAGTEPEPTTAGLTWGMVRRDLHGWGLGYQLFTRRLAWLRQQRPEVSQVRLATSQHTAPTSSGKA
ncbi:MAG: GNAT family N-acetyltransferase [Deinococcus sp.]|nr:GNAT family N-acetyltransferase [Deinococcus sp.]